MFKPAIVWLFRGLLCLAIITTAHAFARHCCVKLPAHKGQQKCCKVEQNWNSTRDVCCDNNSTAKKIHLAAFVPMMHYNKYYSFKHAMLLAMDIINNRTDILPDYELVMHFGDTVSGQPDRALYCLFQWLYTEPVKHMIIGPAFTRALQPVVTAISQWNILGLAYASVSQHLTGFVYRNMYRMVPSTYSFNLAKIAFLKKFKWKRVAIIHGYDDKVFSPTVRHLQTLLDKNNISTIAVEGFQEFLDDVDLRFQIAKFKSLDARIIIGEFSDQGAKHVFCEVYKQKLYGPKYVWFLFGLLSPHIAIKLRSEEFRKLTCTREQLKEVIQGMFGIRSVQLRTDNVTTYSGLNADEYLELMKERAPYVKNSNISTYAFDSVFMAARAFSRVSKTSTPADNFTYKSRSHLKALNKILMADSFEGVSGPLRFNKKKDRFGTVSISQIHNESWKLIGQHFTFDDKLELDDASSIWPGGHVPKDQMIRKEKLLMNDITLIVVIWLLAIIGILLSLAFLYFNIAYRDNRLIKMSSPQLNNLIILGCLLCYVSTILFGLDARFLSFYTYGFNCNARTAVMSIGFSLAFGAMFSKTWRVHKIFTAAKTLKKMAIKDIHLFGIVAVLVVIDTFYLSLWFGYDPLKATKLNFTLQEETINDVIYVPVLYQCTCQYKTYFIAAMYAYKGILLLFGLFLAWETRNVTIPALNDSKYIGMSVYNVVTLSLIGAIVTTALDNTIHYEAPYAISSLCLIICTTATLLLVFVPKVYCFILGSEEQTFNTTTINNGVSSMGRSHGSHAFRFESESSAKPKHFSTKGVQTNHQELTASSGKENENMGSTKSNLNQGFDVNMDDIEINDNVNIPETRYDQEVTENGLVTFMLTDM